MNKLFMAFAKGKESVDAGVVKRYFGVGAVKVLAINPTKKELNQIYGSDVIKDEINYISTNDGSTNVRIDFIVKTIPEKCNGIDITSKLSYFISKDEIVNRDKTKKKVIDKYGRTAWVTNEEFENHSIPVYSNGPANISADYKPCHNGEEELIGAIINYLNIPPVMKYINDKWVMAENPDDSIVSIDNFNALFAGNFAELKDIPTYQPENKFKVMFGVKNSNGKLYQTVYNHVTLKNGVSVYDKIYKDIDDKKANGGEPNTEYFYGEIKEYSVTPTNFDTPTEEVSDFDAVFGSN